MPRTRARRRFYTDRVVAKRRQQIRDLDSFVVGEIEAGEWDRWLSRAWGWGRLSDRSHFDCGSRCFMCHGEKLLGAGSRRRREERAWRRDWAV